MTLISSVLTLMFANKGVTDNTDLIRCNILAMQIENFVNNGGATIDPIKETSAYKSVLYDCGCPDEFLQELLDKAIELKG